MFAAGYLRKPEVQTSYSSGSQGTYSTGGYVWGDKLDIGRTALQYDPYTHEWVDMPLVSKGKNNLKNFQELSMVTNNNVSVSQKGKYGSVRTSLTHVYNKGQYPNQKLNKITYSVSGDMKWKKFSFDGGLTYNKRFYPNDMGADTVVADSFITCWCGRVPNMIYATIRTIGSSRTNSKTGWIPSGMTTLIS